MSGEGKPGEPEKPDTPKERDIRMRLVRGKFPGREFDIDFWQELGDDAISQAVWDLIVLAEEQKHQREPQFRRDVVVFKRGRAEAPEG